jgi:hypothetical protein
VGTAPGDSVGPQGGTLTFENGAVTFEFPPGAVDAPVTITVTPSAREPKRRIAIPGTEFTFGPEGITFAKPVRLTMRYAALPNAVDPSMLAIAKGVGAQWKPIHSASDASAKTITAELSGFSPYGVVNLGFVNIERGCGLTGIGEIWCWGNSWSKDPTQFLEPTKVSGNVTFAGYDSLADHRKLATTEGGACGISTSGELWCGGGGGGAVYASGGLPMVLAAPGHKFAEVSLFEGEVCGIEAPDSSDGGSSDGGDAHAAYCWGDDSRGGLGIGNLTLGQQSFYKTPMKVLGGLDFLHIGVGGGFACGITTSGFTYCWGDETEGQCGRGKGNYTGVPVQVSIQLPGQAQPMPLTLVSISVGGGHACGIDSAGRGVCWGNNSYGQIGDGSPVTGISSDPNLIKLPTAIPGYSWFRLEAGTGNTCGVTGAARTYCWGDVHRLGDGRSISSGQPFGVSTPVEVVDESFFTLALDVNATCGMTTSGSAYCWGDNSHGSLGIGVADPIAMATHTRPEQVKVMGLLP